MRKLKAGDNLKLKIEKGKPVVNAGYIVEVYQNLALVEIDMMSKYCEPCGHLSGNDGNCAILIGPTEESLYLDSKAVNEITQISFLQFNGWRVVASSVGRYNLTVCLRKPKQERLTRNK